MRIKYVKDYKSHSKGEVQIVSPNEGFGLIDLGVAEVTKDITPDDYKQAGDIDGKSTKLRSHNSK